MKEKNGWGCEGKIPFLVVLSGSEFRKVCTCTLIPKNIEKASSRVGSVPWGEAEDFVREFKETLASRFGNKIFNPSVPKDLWGVVSRHSKTHKQVLGVG